MHSYCQMSLFLSILNVTNFLKSICRQMLLYGHHLPLMPFKWTRPYIYVPDISNTFIPIDSIVYPAKMI